MNYLVVALIAAALGGAGAWKVTALHYLHVIDVAAKEASDKVDKANGRADDVASDYEVWQSLQRPKTITITREVEREVQADIDCGKRELPDGLRRALEAAVADANPGVPDQPLPAPLAAPAADLR
jgi:hypothetical protein